MIFFIFIIQIKDHGDHPPITPTPYATQEELGGDAWRIYDYVTRHFLATVKFLCRIFRINS
mgnify:CR=1 FL=1